MPDPETREGHPGSADGGARASRSCYRDDRRPLRDREAVLRVPVDRVDAFLAVDLRAVDFFAVDLRAGARFAAVLRAVDFFAVDLRAVDLRAVVLRAVDFLAVDFLAVVFLAVDLRAVDFLAVAFLAVVFFAVDLRAVVFFLAAAFFAVDFLAVDFLAAAFLRVPGLRVDPERELLRVVAGTAIARSSSALSPASPIADSPHASSGSTVGSLHEPAVDASDVSPVPLQSSWVM